MNIVIVGAGEIGCSIASTLASQEHNVYLIEQDEARARQADEELDVRVIRGNGARPQVLHDAGVSQNGDIDLVVACTNRDEVNMLACWIARDAGVKNVIARARSLEFTDSPTWANKLGISLMVSPERSVAREILEILVVNSATRMAELLDGQAALYSFKVADGSPLVGMSLKDMRLKYSDLLAIVVYVERGDGKNIVPNGDTELHAQDLCYVVTYKESVWMLEKLFQLKEPRPLRRVFIVGGGKLGVQVAHRIQREYGSVRLRLIEQDPQRCERLAEELGEALILNGDGADRDLLEHEGIEEADGYVCTTESDEMNLLYATLAKSLGVKKTIAVVRRRLYQDIPSLIPAVDAVVNPNEALVSVILRTIHYPGHAMARSIMARTDAEMIDLELPKNNRMAGRTLMELNLPPEVLVALMGRENRILLPTGATSLQAGDHLILFATSSRMSDVIEMFTHEGGDDSAEDNKETEQPGPGQEPNQNDEKNEIDGKDKKDGGSE